MTTLEITELKIVNPYERGRRRVRLVHEWTVGDSEYIQYEHGDLGLVVCHGGTVANSYGYPAVTQTAVLIIDKRGRAIVSYAYASAKGTTLRRAALSQLEATTTTAQIWSDSAALSQLEATTAQIWSDIGDIYDGRKPRACTDKRLWKRIALYHATHYEPDVRCLYIIAGEEVAAEWMSERSTYEYERQGK